MSHPGTRTAEAGQGELLLVEQLWDVLINEITCSLSKDKRDAVQRRQARRMPTLHQKYRVRRGKCLAHGGNRAVRRSKVDAWQESTSATCHR